MTESSTSLLFEEKKSQEHIQTNLNYFLKKPKHSPQQSGNVSISVGLECVRSGFMYLASNPDQALAAMDLSAGILPGGMVASMLPPVCIEL